jgi:hypothetical protein
MRLTVLRETGDRNKSRPVFSGDDARRLEYDLPHGACLAVREPTFRAAAREEPCRAAANVNLAQRGH